MRNVHLAAFCAAVLGVLLAVRSSPAEVRAGTAIRLDTQALVDHAEWVVEGRVTRVSVSRDAHGRPQTEVALAISTSFLGEAGGTQIFRIPGGVLADGSGMVLPGLPSFRAGEDVLLFLTRESRAGLRMPVGLAQGKLRVATNQRGERVLVRDSSDLELVDPSSGRSRTADAHEEFAYADLRARIEAAVAKKRAKAAVRSGGAK
jgi:hypothetical protein